MHCLYCHKRLWLFFSKERAFCSKLHEAAYYDELSAMNRLMEFTVPVEPPALPAPRDRKLSEIYRESKIDWALSVAVPPLCKLVVDLDYPRPVTPEPAARLLLQALPFARPIQLPDTSGGLIAFTLDSVIEPEQISTIAIKRKRSRRIDQRNPVAFSSRTHRRRVR
jgi:hypothetical protein